MNALSLPGPITITCASMIFPSWTQSLCGFRPERTGVGKSTFNFSSTLTVAKSNRAHVQCSFLCRYTDRHLVVSTKNVLQALEILPPLINNPERYYEYLWALTFNPERLIRVRWQEEGFTVHRFKRTFFTCADAAGDMSRWSVAEKRIMPEGVRLKYVPEYRQSHKVCAAAAASKS